MPQTSSGSRRTRKLGLLALAPFVALSPAPRAQAQVQPAKKVLGIADYAKWRRNP